ncbi:MAG: DMT family transporter [Euryarchaeota archaeon]|nr:DMT family transporter [Euryarchaeota archaeon]
MDRPQPKHYLLLAVAVASVSPSSVIAKYASGKIPDVAVGAAYAGDAGALVISFYRLLFATLMLLPWGLPAVWRERQALDRRRVGFLAFVGLLLAAHFATWVERLSYTSVASSAVLVTTEAIWVPLGAAFLLRETVGARVWAGVAIAFGGSLLLIYGDAGPAQGGPNPVLGDFLALAGAFAASLYFLAGRNVRQHLSLSAYATVVYGFSTVFLLGFVLVRGEPILGYRPMTYAWMFLFALVPMILGHTIINYILRWMQPHVVSTSILAEPLISALMAYALLIDPELPGLVYVGGLVVILGIAWATTKPSAAPKEQEQGERGRAEHVPGQEGPSVVDLPQPPGKEPGR